MFHLDALVHSVPGFWPAPGSGLGPNRRSPSTSTGLPLEKLCMVGLPRGRAVCSFVRHIELAIGHLSVKEPFLSTEL